MKNILFLIMAFLFMAFSAQSQRHYYNAFALDTLTDAATVTLTDTKRFYDVGVIEYHCALDSLTGTPAGTVKYQYALDPAGEEWYTVSTDAFSSIGTEGETQHQVTNFSGVRARILVVGTGTQSTEVNASIAFKRNR